MEESSERKINPNRKRGCMFCDAITGDWADTHGYCPEHAIAYSMLQLRMSLEQATEYVQKKLAQKPESFAPNTSGAKATEPLKVPEQVRGKEPPK